METNLRHNEVLNFRIFYSEITNLCSQISMIDRCYIFNLRSQEKQRVNDQYIKSIKKSNPDAVFGFFIAMRKANYGIDFLLADNFEVIIKFQHKNSTFKEIRSHSVESARENIPAYINFLTSKWNPLNGDGIKYIFD